MTSTFENRFEAICAHARHAAVLQSVADTLEWDEQTLMPSLACDYRAKQVATIRAINHSHLTEPAYGENLQMLWQSLDGHEPSGVVATTLRELHRHWQRNCRLPVSLVKHLANTRVRAHQAWESARTANDFGVFAPHLSEMVALKREEGSLLAEGGDAYEALLQDYEPGAKVQAIADLFASLRGPLVDLVARLSDLPRRPDVSPLQRPCSLEGQKQLSRFVAESIGFDFKRGRLDETSHPFCTTLGPNDCRILTRYDEHWFPAGLFGTLHEAGHGIYEQGLRTDWYGLPPGSYASLGIHESQSRLWENQVGRSLSFWKWLLPRTKPFLGESLAGYTPQQIHAAVNQVQPSLIRVEADEATYNLHIIIRFELEKRLLSGELQVADLPAAWNEAYRCALGIEVPSAADGVLQDVHWSAGLFGYFPTYTIGNLAAAQLFEAAKTELGPLGEQFENGDFQPLKDWLWRQIHRHGCCYSGDQLILNATQAPLSTTALLTSLRTRYDAIYR
ncbi:MAG: carboxypeptidase M32 [Planctomycetaceae bacterium]